MGKIINDADSPVSVNPWQTLNLYGINLRIGEGHGKTRIANLNPRQARLVAYALLYQAEKLEMKNNSK